MKIEHTTNDLLEASIRSFIRYGIKKTTMSDIATEAGVSRPTLYASYKNKEEVLAAAISYLMNKSLSEVLSRWVGVEHIADRLDIFFEVMVVANYELMQQSPEAEDLQHGYSVQGKAAVYSGNLLSRDVLVSALEPFRDAIASNGESLESFAYFIVNTATGFKHSAVDSADLTALLHALKAATLTVCGVSRGRR